MSLKNVILLKLFFLSFTLTAAENPAYQRTPAPPGAEVYFLSPQEGETVKSPVTIKFGLKGMGVAPAGIQKENTGHHHLLIDVTYDKKMFVIPADKKHIHFGGGQTETTVNLSPGKHSLQLVLGDHAHIPHEPAIVSKVIYIKVK